MPNLSRRQVVTAAAVAGLSAHPALARAGYDDPRLNAVDPELRAAARAALLTPGPPLNRATLDGWRRTMASLARPPLASPPVERRLVGTEGAYPGVSVYVVNARPGGRRPAILHIHGGGHVMGEARASVPDLQRLAAELDCVIVTADYRLAPEAAFAESTHDTYAALRWLHRDAEALGADPARIAVMGESAGGGHAALLALAARDRGEVPLLFQALIYPMLDDRTGTTCPASVGIGGLVWTAAQNRFGWESFLGQPPGTDAVPPSAVPSRRRDLAGLPPAFIGVGSIDLFVEEDVNYASRLIGAGVQTELLVVPGAFHAFDLVAAGTGVARRFTAAKIAALRRAFERTASAGSAPMAPRLSGCG